MKSLDHINPIIKLTEGCNYNCYFCRYANYKRTDEGIDENLIFKMVFESISFNKEHGKSKINVIFHGGEPLLYGAKRLSSVLECIQSMVDDSIVVEYSIQTNSSLITDEWIDVFKKYNFDVGISLDGPPLLNEHCQTNKNKSVIEAVKKYHLLKLEKVRCGFLSVITNKHLLHLNEFFEFFVDNKIDSLGLCFCYDMSGNNNVDPLLLGKWLVGLYDLYYDSSHKINIREFDNATKRIIKKYKNIYEGPCRNNCGSYLTLQPDGRIDFCDDYDRGAENILGNLKVHSVCDILDGIQYKNHRCSAFAFVEEKCNACEVRCICRGGCARNDNNGNNYFCDTYKIIYPYIEKKVLDYLIGKGY